MSAHVAVGDQALAAGQPRKWVLWAGRVLSALPVLAMALSAAMKLSRQPQLMDTIAHKLGYPPGLVPAIAILELACAVIYTIPRTAVLGAVLLTGFLGGAVATHVRVGEPFFVPLALGALAWAGLYLRDERLRALLPFKHTN
jgi:hypothetical protein